MRAKKTPVARPVAKPTAIFNANPSELKVVNFTLQKRYTMKFKLQNVSTHTHGFQVRGPADPAFSYRIVEEVDTSRVRPGLHLTFEVTFLPTEPKDYESSILILPGENEIATAISIRCYRDPPKLQLANIVDLGATLVYSSKNGAFTVKNTGGRAAFSFHSVTGHEDSPAYTDGALSLVPAEFELDRGESIGINVRFKPS